MIQKNSQSGSVPSQNSTKFRTYHKTDAKWEPLKTMYLREETLG